MSLLQEYYSGSELVRDWGMSDQELERRHDYIQWWFPLPEPSRAVPNSPRLSPEDLRAFQTPMYQDRMRVSLARMLVFYALNPLWKRPRDHNYLRITRILRSLTLAGLREEALDFRDWVIRQKPDAGEQTLEFWASATEPHK
jgi:hypothetical protein